MPEHQVDRTLQWGLIPFYAILTMAGVAIVVFAPPSMTEVMGSYLARITGLFLLLGGSICFGGMWVPRGKQGDWIGEFVGLRLVISAITVYATVAALTLDRVPGRLGGVLIFYAFTLLLVVRLLRVCHDAGLDPPIIVRIGARILDALLPSPPPHART